MLVCVKRTFSTDIRQDVRSDVVWKTSAMRWSGKSMRGEGVALYKEQDSKYR